MPAGQALQASLTASSPSLNSPEGHDTHTPMEALPWTLATTVAFIDR